MLQCVLQCVLAGLARLQLCHVSMYLYGNVSFARVLQNVSVRCSMLQCVAVCCSRPCQTTAVSFAGVHI